MTLKIGSMTPLPAGNATNSILKYMRLYSKVQQVIFMYYLFLSIQWRAKVLHIFFSNFSVYLVINTNGVTCCTLVYSIIYALEPPLCK